MFVYVVLTAFFTLAVFLFLAVWMWSRSLSPTIETDFDLPDEPETSQKMGTLTLNDEGDLVISWDGSDEDLPYALVGIFDWMICKYADLSNVEGSEQWVSALIHRCMTAAETIKTIEYYKEPAAKRVANVSNAGVIADVRWVQGTVILDTWEQGFGIGWGILKRSPTAYLNAAASVIRLISDLTKDPTFLRGIDRLFYTSSPSGEYDRRNLPRVIRYLRRRRELNTEMESLNFGEHDKQIVALMHKQREFDEALFRNDNGVSA
jgi:hypothetical protein